MLNIARMYCLNLLWQIASSSFTENPWWLLIMRSRFLASTFFNLVIAMKSVRVLLGPPARWNALAILQLLSFFACKTWAFIDTGKAVVLTGWKKSWCSSFSCFCVKAQCAHCIVAQPLTVALQSSFLPVPVSSLGFSLCHISCELDWPVHRHLSPFPSNHVPSSHLLVVGVGTLSRFVHGLFVTTDRAFEVLCSSVFGCRNCVTGDTIAIFYLFIIGQFQSDSKVYHNGKLTNFTMNYYELLTLIQSYHSIFTFLVNRGLIAASWKCHGFRREYKLWRRISLWMSSLMLLKSGSSFFEVLKIPPGLMAVHHFPLVSWRVQQESISANWIITWCSRHHTSETQKHLLHKNPAWRHHVVWSRKDSRDQWIYVWP